MTNVLLKFEVLYWLVVGVTAFFSFFLHGLLLAVALFMVWSDFAFQKVVWLPAGDFSRPVDILAAVRQRNS